MDGWLLAVAWGAGVAGLLLVADMIKTDLACRRLERVAISRHVAPRRRRD